MHEVSATKGGDATDHGRDQVRCFVLYGTKFDLILCNVESMTNLFQRFFSGRQVERKSETIKIAWPKKEHPISKQCHKQLPLFLFTEKEILSCEFVIVKKRDDLHVLEEVSSNRSNVLPCIVTEHWLLT